MKVVFLGFQAWGWVALKGLLESKHQVELVLTHSQDRCVYKGSFLDRSVHQLAESHNIPFIVCQTANKGEIIDKIKEISPDVIVSSDWETWISPEVAALANKAAINIHDALLPKYAGFSPVNWAIINGEKKTGVTIHYIEEEFDQGKIIAQETVFIEDNDTAAEVLKKILNQIPEIVLKSLDLIESEKVEAKKQEVNDASFYHKISKKDCQINWHDSCDDVYSFIRALSDPFSNAYTYFKGKKLEIKKASKANTVYCGIPGRLICRQEDGVIVLCGRVGINKPQGILLKEIQDQDGRIWKAKEYFPKMGDYLGDK
ncbi:MAG: methionyl-tRNA formyltransferase [Candidatus Zapsychrus exili]|nr:methionyl-tRNA formyltransferase [Candidatus Zapsychrus exili]